LSVKGAGKWRDVVSEGNPVGRGTASRSGEGDVGHQLNVIAEIGALVLIEILELSGGRDLDPAFDNRRDGRGTSGPGWREREGQTTGEEHATEAEGTE